MQTEAVILSSISTYLKVIGEMWTIHGGGKPHQISLLNLNYEG